MRAIVITESLTDGQVPQAPGVSEIRRYRHLLDDRTPIEIVELTVPADQAPAYAHQLADALLPRLYYAHLIDEEQMLVAFPHTVVRIRRGGERAIALAQSIGALVGIPAEQMRFAEMWDTDHPDAPATALAEAERS
ncbi:hypothetical protein AB0A60_32945 [Streptomyces sp. NPDC046275]|uniref:hypothetical protein n=1 Tax=Streptomyces sp. NPDC046275 TaxID=3157201 RepID=UPI00340CBAA6